MNPSLAWDLEEICDAAAKAMRAESKRLDAEQSPYGLDAPHELPLQDVIRRGMRAAGYGVLAEQRYPAARNRRRRSEGDRCDIVLLRDADATLDDPLEDESLFGGGGVDPSEALWLEVKTAHQFALIDGVAEANRSYSAELLTAATKDVRKLAVAEGLQSTALLLALFSACAESAEHDLDVWANRCLVKGHSIATPIRRGFPIADRLGNERCTIALIEVYR